MLKPNPLAPFLIKIGGFRDRPNDDESREGDPSRELVLDPPGEFTGWITRSSEKMNPKCNARKAPLVSRKQPDSIY